MRRYSIILLLAFSIFNTVFTQTIEIPDNNFLNALLSQGVDSNNDKAISQNEAAAVTELDVNYKNIKVLDGIEAFVNLTSLDCGDNSIATIDLNKLTKLEYLWCQNNSLTELDISACSKLKVLTLNTNQIKSINLENNPDIFWLDLSFTHIDSINLEGLHSIETIACMYSPVRSLIVPDKPYLEQIIASGCKISTINVSNDTALRVLEINGNLIEELDLTSCKSMEYLAIRDMPELSRICTPYLPFQSESLTISASGSPNINFTDCISPTLTGSKTEVSIGDTIEFLSSEDGDFYLLSDSINPVLTSLVLYADVHMGVAANTTFEVILNDTMDCTYCAYSVDLYENISESFCFTYYGDTSKTAVKKIIPSMKTDRKIKIYPNPVTNCLNIEAREPYHIDITISTMNGQAIIREEMEHNTHKIDISSLKSGIYYLIMHSNDFVETEKIMKL